MDLVILYDSTCVLCARSKARLDSWPTANQMRLVAIQSPEAKEYVPDVPPESLMGQMHVIEEGRVYGGADGWYRIMKVGPLGLAWLAWVTPKWMARPVYGVIARNRYRWFGKIECEEGTCAIHPPRGDRR